MNPTCRVRSRRWKWHVSDLRIIAPYSGGAEMGYKYGVGQDVYYNPPVRHAAPPGPYKIVARLPVELEGRRVYRIKSGGEKFERTPDESELSPAD
jgi:hypothetical protein